MGAAHKLGLMALALAIVAGCSAKQPPESSYALGSVPNSNGSTPKELSNDTSAASRTLPFKGHLAEGNPNDVPPLIARSLAPDSPITFSYREELTHDDYHIPLIVSAFDPVTYVGAPLGDFGVTAFASLTIFDHDRVIGDYTAKTHVSRSYTLYHEPTHREVEEAARAAVREKIDAKLADDSERLAAAIKQTPDSPASEPPQ